MKHFIGNDLHTRYQVVAWIDEQTGEICKRRLEHTGEEVRSFTRSFRGGRWWGSKRRCRRYWFERLLEKAGARVVGGRRGAHSSLRGARSEA